MSYIIISVVPVPGQSCGVAIFNSMKNTLNLENIRFTAMFDVIDQMVKKNKDTWILLPDIRCPEYDVLRFYLELFKFNLLILRNVVNAKIGEKEFEKATGIKNTTIEQRNAAMYIVRNKLQEKEAFEKLTTKSKIIKPNAK